MRILILGELDSIDPTHDRLVSWGHTTGRIEDVDGALSRLTDEAWDVVFGPGRSGGGAGLELCRRVRDTLPELDTYLVVVDRTGTPNAATDAMSEGADDVLLAPVDDDALRARLLSGQRTLDLRRSLHVRNHYLSAANDSLERALDGIRKDLAAASRAQRALLPRPGQQTAGARFGWFYLPCAYLAGDMLGFFDLGDAGTGFYLLDVAGHGVPAAMLSLTLSRILAVDDQRSSLLTQVLVGGGGVAAKRPDEVVTELNQRFLSGEDSDEYFTMIYGVLDADGERLHWTQAGHPHPILLRAGEPPRMLGEGGFPVGVLDGMDYSTTTTEIQPGDRLFLYSDGMTDCRDAAGEPFGNERLLEGVEDTRGLDLKEQSAALERRVLEWSAEVDLVDDVSVLVAEVG